MAARDIHFVSGGGTVRRFRAESNQYVGFAEGDAAKVGGTGTNYAIPCLNGDPEQGTDLFLGVTHSAATNTASADGVVDVEMVLPGSVLRGRMNTPANVNTDTLLLGVLNDQVAFDRSADTAAGVLTIDENEGTDAAVHALLIVDGDVVAGTLLVMPALGWWVGTV